MRLKTAVFTTFAVGFLLAGLFMGVIPPQQAQAAGETWTVNCTATNANACTITGKGGALHGTNTFKYLNNGSRFEGYVRYTNNPDCYLHHIIVIEKDILHDTIKTGDKGRINGPTRDGSTCTDANAWKQLGNVVNDGEIYINITLTAGEHAPENDGTIGDPDEGEEQDDLSPELTCEVSIINPLTWLVCPIVAAAQGAVGALNDAIDSLMNINTGTGSAFDTSGETGKAFRTAWNSFRVIGTAVIIIAALMMVIAQAAGFEFLDAYTIRKTLPRLLIAAIFVTLSWYVVAFFIQLSNDVGNSVRAIIYQPFSGIGDGTIRLGQDGALVASLVGGVAITALGLLGMATFALGALVAVFFGFVILMIRKLIILMCIIFAPFAIACYALPNTQRVFTFWRDTLISMLVVFPIISAFIAIGRVFAVVAYTSGGSAAFVEPSNSIEHGFAILAYNLGFAQTTGSPGLLPTIEAFFAYFAPYLLMKQAFDLAGGLIRTVKSGFDNASAGIRGGIKNARANKAKENWGKLKSGNRFEGTKYIPGTRKLASLANSASIGATHGFGITGKSRQAISTQRQMTAADMAKDPRWETIKDWDDATRAVANWDNAGDAYNGLVAHNRSQISKDFQSGKINQAERDKRLGQVEANAKAAVNAVKATVGFGRPQQILGAQAFIATGTAPVDEKDMVQTLARASHGDVRVAGALGGAASGIAARAGRHDLNRGAGATQKLVMSAMENNNTPDQKMLDESTNAAFDRENIYAHMNAKDASTKAYTEDFTRQLKQALQNGDREKAVQINRYLLELQGGLSQAKAGPAAAVRKALAERDRMGSGVFSDDDMKSIMTEAATNARRYGSGKEAGEADAAQNRAA